MSKQGDIIWFCGASWIRGPKECSEGWLVNWFCQPTAWYVYNHCLTYVILIWFYKHQQQCIQQGIGPRLLFYHDYFTDEHVRKELHMLHTMFLLADSCKIIWTLLLFCYSVSSSGEIKNSYGFDSSGKKALDSEFSEYGQSFGVDDVVGCYLVSAWTVIKSHSCSRSWNQTVSNKLLGNVKM